MKKKIRVAVIGLGWVAVHRHIPAILRHPDFRLCGVIDHHKDKAKEIAQKLGLPFFAETDKLNAVEWLDAIDALVIATPPFDHLRLAIDGFAKGKHILTEKPFALDTQEGHLIAASAQKAGKTLAIVHNFQFSRAARKLDRDLKSGKLGQLTRISAVQLGNPARRLPLWYEKLPFGLFYDESPHFFYLLRKLAGPLTLEKAHAVKKEEGPHTPDLVHLLYRNKNKLPVTIDCHFKSALSEWYILVTGEKYVALLDIFRDIYIRLPNDGAHGAMKILRTSLWAIGQHAAAYLPNGLALLRGRLDYGNDEIYARFACSILNGKEPQDISADDALAVLHLQHEAISALQSNLVS